MKLVLPTLIEAASTEEGDYFDPITYESCETVDYDSSNKEHVAAVIASRILKDLRDRRGLRQEFEQCNDDIKLEIFESWKELALGVLNESNC